MKTKQSVRMRRAFKDLTVWWGCFSLVLPVCLAGCSKPMASAGAASQSGASASNACDRKLVTTSDAVQILGQSVESEKTLPGDAQSCVFTTPGFTTLTITVRPGKGKATVDAWASGNMPAPVTSASGIGERAVWQSTLKEIIAEKNNVLCDIGVVGPGPNPGATPEKLGALCNKIFAGM